jgi:mono/diheme cytochrome c family protein
MKGLWLFVVASAVVLALTGYAAYKDATTRQYLAVQDQYRKDYGGAFSLQVQQLFPAFSEATVGGTFRTERCISCHVPDIGTIGPEVAAQRLSQDFFKYEPDAKQIAADNHLTGTHPAYISTSGGNYPPSISYTQNGAPAPGATPPADGFHPYTFILNGQTKTTTAQLQGLIPYFLNPANSSTKVGIDTAGCIVCHNGNRGGLEESDAHQNLIINPTYAFTEGAALYYKNCATCHGGAGEGGVGPPLNNQDRLGFFNEDYYYRCIEYGFTDFEHYGSIMPNWGSIAPDFHYDSARDKQQPNPVRVLSEQEIQILIQFIRHWENYSTLP